MLLIFVRPGRVWHKLTSIQGIRANLVYIVSLPSIQSDWVYSKESLIIISFFRYKLKLFTSFLEIKLLLRKCTKIVQKMYGREQKTPYTKQLQNKKGQKKFPGARFWVSFSQLPAVKKDTKNCAPGNIFWQLYQFAGFLVNSSTCILSY